jgi:hypothetical protein
VLDLAPEAQQECREEPLYLEAVSPLLNSLTKFKQLLLKEMQLQNFFDLEPICV